MFHEDVTGTRILQYKGILKKLKALGMTRVYSSNLADSLGVSASLVRKDFTVLTASGNKRGGYQIDALMEEINRFLHKEKPVMAVLAGVGKLGAALLDYRGFAEENITFAAAFDIDPATFRDGNSGIGVYPMETMADYITRHKIGIGVIAVPGNVAQQVADMMVLAGVKGFLNFAPTRLVLPEYCLENHINLALELEKLVFQVEHTST